MRIPRLCLPLVPLLLLHPAQAAAPFVLARDGRAAAAIVTSDHASAVIAAAADDLQKYLKRITGVEFAVKSESAAGSGPLIVVGGGKLASAAGIETAAIEAEGYVIRTAPNRLFIVGADRTPLDRGTAYGVTDFLEREAGVRWLWPGALGTIVPHRPTFVVTVDRTEAPALHLRQFRDAWAPGPDAARTPRGIEYYGMDSSRHQAMAKDSTEWLSHTRVGVNAKANYSHAFGTWYRDYHQSHPEFFAMMPDGSREWPWNNDRQKLCVSNPGVLRQWVENARVYFRNNPDAMSFSASPNDSALDGHCTCAECEKWDDPRGEVYQMNWRAKGMDVVLPHVSVSDRYCHFYNLAAAALEQEFPGKMVGAYAYSSWSNPPLHERNLRKNMLLGFVGSPGIYISNALFEKERANWDDWSGLVKNLFYRPNVFHSGNGLPLVFIHKLAADLKYRYAHGMIGCDYDSLLHHWATQGINYYVLTKLLWNPHEDVDAVLDDYVKEAFGPAAKPMKEYYLAVESNTDAISRRPTPEKPDRLDFARSVPRFYSAQILAGWRGILHRAQAAVPANSDYARRIAWVMAGVDYAEASAHVFALTLRDGGPADHDVIVRASAARDNWQRAHLYDWTVYGPVLFFREVPPAAYGR